MSTATALITGVSTGIGRSIAARLVETGWSVFGTVRSDADAGRVTAELGSRFVPLVLDVTDPEAVAEGLREVTTRTSTLSALINNAGISEAAPLLHVDPVDFRRHYDVNVVGALQVTQAAFPLLRAAAVSGGRSRVVNVSSVAGKIAYPYMGAYAASKHALEAMSDALRRELTLYGIDVVVVEPSTVKTPIIGKFAAQLERYFDTDYGPSLRELARGMAGREASALPVSKVVDAVVAALHSPRPKTRYPIPRSWLTSWILPRCLPDRVFDALVVRRLALRSKRATEAGR